MRVSYQWLSEYVDLTGISPQELAERLTASGVAVDGIEVRNQGVSGVVVGQVITCEQHPNADRLHVCEVDAGTGELLTIVCGAPNVAAGQKVPTALPGAVLPGGKIGKAKLRGVESYGMLCSAQEIGLETRLLQKEQTEGLYVLPEDAPIGQDIVPLLGLDDVVLELDLTPNRSDCLSMRGLAYEVAAVFGTELRFDEDVRQPQTSAVNQSQPSVAIALETPQCSRYEAQVLEGLSANASPLWMQMRLMAMGVRPINQIVDITNYVMLEWGQPLHAFDLDQVHEQTIVVRQGRPNETLVTLDGEERQLNEDTVVIADVHRAIGIAGVMGGENSEITSQTRRVVLESAAFDATSVRRTGQRLGLRSEAQQRFEKGIDPKAVRGALFRATQLMIELCDGQTVGSYVAAASGQTQPAQHIVFSPSRCNQLLGTSIEEKTMLDIFQRLGFSVEAADGTWDVVVPTRRPDLAIEADLVEEVGRLYGLDSIPSTLPSGATTVGVRNVRQKLVKRTRDILIGTGLTEVFTYTLTHPSQLDDLRIPDASPYRQMIPLQRPMSEERTVLRTHMLPGLAQVAHYNLAHGVAGGEVFEIGRVYWPDSLPLTAQPCERTQWAGLWFGQTEASVGKRARKYDFYDAKGVVEAWLDAMGWTALAEFRPIALSWLHPRRSAEVVLNGERIGTFGELHPFTADKLDIGNSLYAEFDLDLLEKYVSERWRVEKLPRFPASRRDLAVVVAKDLSVQSLLDEAKRISEATSKILESSKVFDVYTGSGIPEGQKSVAVALTYRSDERTLTDEEVSELESAIVQDWTAKFGAQLRSH
ncbi:phenylalanine--tRNA ligase subunit beta [Alicyclobacillus tolerans]|uniref:phenylalanine--tRNA ligase subunit beta n=1 Tax=Alicyclobacillus tolerans TaxID=90970 RepID=UPI001F018AA7|nr:phenylalanine--tRNA ligase subunit beta [Alicyclobacillus tolerans]MCF8565218.1 phenylalanine--tRNA ligase subunit beta [Alicyclobacillus tolerans]